MPRLQPGLLLLVLSLAAGLAGAEPPRRTDAAGDPLPDEALARLGTTRFRLDQYAMGVAVSADGTRIAVSGRNSQDAGIRILDAATGKEVKRLAGGGPGSESEVLTFSPDGKLLAGTARFGGQGVQVFDTNTGDLVRTLQDPNRENGLLRFSADGKVLVTGAGLPGRAASAVAWDLSVGKELGRFALSGDELMGVAVSPDGKLAAGWGQRGGGVVLWDVATGKETQRLGAGEAGYRPGGAAFSPDGRHVAVAEYAAVSVWDVATGKPVYRSAARAGAGLLAYSPDGKTLAAADSGAVQLWDAATGKRLGLYGGLRGQPLALVFADDRLLAVGRSGAAVWVRDVKAGKWLSPAGGHEGPIRSIAFTPDGREVLTSSTDGVLAWDARTGKELRRLAIKESTDARMRDLPGRPRTVDISPNAGRLLAATDIGGTSVVDAATGEVEFDLDDRGRNFGRGLTRAFSADGSVLAVAPERFQPGGEARVWNLSSGQELPRLKVKYEEAVCVAVAPDGKAAAVASASRRGMGDACEIQLWDTATGKERLTIPTGAQIVQTMAFAPDGAVLAAPVYSPQAGGNAVVLWEAGTGREARRLACDPVIASNLAFSPDGRTLALITGVNGPQQTFRLRVWELASGTVRRELPAAGYGGVLAFSPDGRTLAAGSADTTVTLWDVGGRLVAPAAEGPSAKQLEELWAALEDPDGDQAQRAMARLAASPKETAEFLATRVRPAEGKALDAAAIDRLIADLESEEFKTRDRATKELAKAGALARSALEKALQGKPPPEQRRRIEQLLESMAGSAPRRDELRTTRAVELLERLGTPEARALLKALSEGQPDARQTRDARDALARLARQ